MGKNKKWLAEQMEVTQPAISYFLREKPIGQAEKIAEILQLNPRDLII